MTLRTTNNTNLSNKSDAGVVGLEEFGKGSTNDMSIAVQGAFHVLETLLNYHSYEHIRGKSPVLDLNRYFGRKIGH